MKKIVAMLQPFDLKQIVYVYENGNKIKVVEIETAEVANTICTLAQEEKVEESIPGVFSDESFSPSMTNSSIRSCQIIGIFWFSVTRTNLKVSGTNSGYSSARSHTGVTKRVTIMVKILVIRRYAPVSGGK